MKLVVLAGGMGSRLRSEISDVPKPLAPINGIPFLSFQIENWISQGITSLVFLLHYKADLIVNFLEQKNKTLSSCKIEWCIEPSLLGTGGAISFAVKKFNLSGSFLVINADTWLSSGVRKLYEEKTGSLGVILHSDCSRYGQVHFNKQGFVTSFSEKVLGSGVGYIYSGICLLKAKYFKGWENRTLSLENEIFPKLLKNEPLRAVPLVTDFIDIGIPEDYKRYCVWQENNRKGTL